jgi:DNA-binding XRE family transcriptional regulator
VELPGDKASRIDDRCGIASNGRLGAFLKSLRLRIDPFADRLGPFERLSFRRGRVVSQQELADAIEVSRNWYTLLESGRAIRTSPRLLARLAEVLMLSGDERARLFRIAIPELRSTKLEHASGQDEL